MSKLKKKISTQNNGRAYPLIGFIADTHLHRENAPLVIDIFQQFINLLLESDIRMAVHLGDWFTDRSAQNVGRLGIIREIINLFAAHNIVLHTIPGNHDKQDLAGVQSYLTPYFSPQDPMFRLYETNDMLMLDEHNIMLHFAPYWPEEDHTYLEQLVAVNLPTAQIRTDLKHILCTHTSVNGARNNDGTLVTTGVDAEEFKKFNKVLTGHYHDMSRVGENIYYIGSSYQAHYGEDVSKGFCIMYSDCTLEWFGSTFKPYVKYHVPASQTAKVREVLSQAQTGKFAAQHTRIIFEGSAKELEAIDRRSFEKFGVEVKFNNTVELSVDEEQIDKAEFAVLDSGLIKKHFVSYMADRKYSPKQKGEALRYLKHL